MKARRSIIGSGQTASGVKYGSASLINGRQFSKQNLSARRARFEEGLSLNTAAPTLEEAMQLCFPKWRACMCSRDESEKRQRPTSCRLAGCMRRRSEAKLGKAMFSHASPLRMVRAFLQLLHGDLKPPLERGALSTRPEGFGGQLRAE